MTQEALDNWLYCDDYVAEDEVILSARDAADQLGCVPVHPGAGALLTVLAQAIRATSVVEVGTGTGVSTVYLLRGMTELGTVTSIDVEAEHHKVARETVARAGFAAERMRPITGRALDVLPRLADAGYDLVFVDAHKPEYPAYVEQGLRLLRPGGLLVLDNALWHGRVADPAQRDPNTTAIREAIREVRVADGVTSVLLPAGDGLLVAVKG